MVEAVELEELLKARRMKGPRILIRGTEGIGPMAERLVYPVTGEDGLYELLWPNACLWGVAEDEDLDQLTLRNFLEVGRIGQETFREVRGVADHYFGLQDLLMRSIAREYLRRIGFHPPPLRADSSDL